MQNQRCKDKSDAPPASLGMSRILRKRIAELQRVARGRRKGKCQQNGGFPDLTTASMTQSFVKQNIHVNTWICFQESTKSHFAIYSKYIYIGIVWSLMVRSVALCSCVCETALNIVNPSKPETAEVTIY